MYRIILKMLMELCIQVMARSEFNRMMATNLCIVIAPNVMRSRDSNPAVMMSESQDMNDFVKVLLEQWPTISQATSWQK